MARESPRLFRDEECAEVQAPRLARRETADRRGIHAFDQIERGERRHAKLHGATHASRENGELRDPAEEDHGDAGDRGERATVNVRARRDSAPATTAAAGYASRYPPVGPKNRAIPGAPIGVNTGRPAAPATR